MPSVHLNRSMSTCVFGGGRLIDLTETLQNASCIVDRLRSIIGSDTIAELFINRAGRHKTVCNTRWFM
jgi:hypothetical protein